ncbi:phytanoyl-CoA dioxygenase family protein [Xylaria arbuscula]|nr:phytanoyl-CoA dioxygenase family protein [Xylaria arbuscula]
MAIDLDMAKAQLKEHGWTRIPSILSEQEASSVLSRLWKAKDDAEARGDDTYYPFLDPNTQNVRVFFLMELDQIFRDLISHPTAIEMVSSVLGDNFLISNFTANIARPGSQSMTLHSDQSLVFPEPWHDTWAVNVIWCLTDVTKENGATMYIPGSHRWTKRDQVPKNAPELLVPFEATAGDIILLDGRVWHTSGSNITSDQDRALLFGYYTKPFVRQQVNWTAKMGKELQEALSPEMKKWLGLEVSANMDVNQDWRYMAEQYPDFAPKKHHDTVSVRK